MTENMFEAKNELTDILKKVNELSREFCFSAGMLKSLLNEVKKAK